MPLDPISRALQLARSALGTTSPNPSVGCVLTDAAGQTLGEGHTQRAGGPHAEIIALRDAAARGHDVRGATAWVTLEPCSHHGRTGPCCDALVAAGIRRVVASLADPNPLVAGQGFGRLRAAGVEVEVGAGADEARELNIGFFSRMERQLPWVRLKAAASLDGRTALDNGQSQWITSQAARVDGHAWRARACAILTGVGTVLQDNPRLDVRLVQTPRQPRLVIVDSQLNTPPDAELFSPSREVWIYTACPDAARQAALASRGAVVIALPGAGRKVDLVAMLQDLARREINELHVEAGHKLNGSLFREGLVDELLLYVAPRLLGQGAGIAHLGPYTSLSEAPTLDIHTCERVGPDLRILARRVQAIHKSFET
ncbi:MAG: bifunctional diaminohydroxyphosphoribosylaminopyrimidine deaminase/5-amino-6-(5-phosphoribosylamino)uracil reductase RibD [Proteobacteria bacterium]|jgi:diaminohydroxyphosphoribosylaminopyrimidine deaminase/5-amino-6-(5-phosphoribosylamino)uracil reductase|nr:bifunctional diaminohydroxyphosphoribosylaminopyrimidine deaminase/5-amino-6-(5-phosphoribosylamino)uracil reductase RibD [Ramlibacter sp.]MCA0214080.1 bifunctional diaminohydroxyphosphoribosylaminopyrimidine deaminase/5-amino-6-(5-phosphoribosylamino)uracil reductase RibD [Pseudomonadota bacterium]